MLLVAVLPVIVGAQVASISIAKALLSTKPLPVRMGDAEISIRSPSPLLSVMVLSVNVGAAALVRYSPELALSSTRERLIRGADALTTIVACELDPKD